MPSVEIISIGTELLLGEIQDTNTAFLARGLRELGMDVFRTQMVGDNVERISTCIREALGRATIVITTGGLGPTVDDPTRQAVASACDRILVFHPELWEQIETLFHQRGRSPTENQKKQAFLPQGAIVISNPVGTAPAFVLELDYPGDQHPKCIISLPGVPGEMEIIFTDSVIPHLVQRYQTKDVIRVRILHTSGMGEGQIDDLIADLELLANPTVGLAAHSGIVDIRIAVKDHVISIADNRIAGLEKRIRARLGNAIFGVNGETLEEIALKAAGMQGWMLGCLEFGLSGELLNRLSSIHSPSFAGGRTSTSSSSDLRRDLLNLKTELKCDTTLGVQLTHSPSAQLVHIILMSPMRVEEKNIQHIGPPMNAGQWAANMALDYLRRCSQEPKPI